MFGIGVVRVIERVALIGACFLLMGVRAHATLQVSSLKLTSTSVAGGSPTTLTVTLNTAAPQGGATVNLSSKIPAAAQIASTATVATGAKSVTVPISTSPVDFTVAVTMSAGIGKQTPKTASLTVKGPALASVSFAPSEVPEEATPNIIVKLTSPSGPHGALVKLKSSNSDVAEPPDTLSVAPKGTSATGIMTTDAVNSDTAVSITATLGVSTQKGKLTVQAAVLETVNLPFTSVTGGNEVDLSVTLSGPAGPDGVEVKLASSAETAAKVPANVLVAEGETSGTAKITTLGVDIERDVEITATLGKTTKTASLSVGPASLKSLTVDPSTLPGGSTGTLTVTMDGDVGPKGATVNLTCGSELTVPKSVLIPKGNHASESFKTWFVNLAESTSITASYNTQSLTTIIQVLAPLEIALDPDSVVGGNTSTLTVTVDTAAGSKGTSITLTSSAPKVASVPASVLIPPGETSATTTVTTYSSNSTQAVKISAQNPTGGTALATLNVNPSANVVGMTFKPQRVKGGSSTQLSVTISSPAGPGGIVVNLSTSLTGIGLPATVTIPQGTTTGSVTLTTSPVTNTNWVKVTAELGDKMDGSFVVTNAVLANSPWPTMGGDVLGTGLGNGSGAIGTFAWTFTPTNTNPTLNAWSTPVVGADGTIYETFGSASSENWDIGKLYGYLYAFSPNGAVKWSFNAGKVMLTPTIGADGTIYVTSWDPTDNPSGYLHALTPNGVEKWKILPTDGANNMGEYGKPIIGADGTIYVTGQGCLFAVNPDGTQKWFCHASVGYSESLLNPVIGHDGTIYVTSTNQVFGIGSDGVQKWYSVTNGANPGSLSDKPAVSADGTIYVGSSDGNLYAINPDGSAKASLTLGGTIGTPAIGSNGTIYVTSQAGAIYAVSPGTGVKWQFAVTDIGANVSIAGDGTLYVTGENGVYALNQDGALKWNLGGVWPSWGIAIGADGTLYGATTYSVMAIK